MARPVAWAGQSRAGAAVYVSVIPISVARPVARAEQSCPDTTIGITLT